MEDVFSPVVRFEPKVCFQYPSERENQPGTTSGIPQRRPFFQSLSLLSSEHYGHYLHTPTMRVDAFYALHDIFAFVACSENQFLNMLKTKYHSHARRTNNINQLESQLDNLRYHKAIVQDHIEQLQSVIECIQNRSDSHWVRPKPPRPASGQGSSTEGRGEAYDRLLATYESDVQRAETAASMLVRDFQGLLQKAQGLSQCHGERIDDIRTGNMLAESRKATEQARSVTRLTLLAFWFLPLSFTTSIFGMNFRELGTHLSIWVWVATSVPVFLFALVCCFWTDFARVLKVFHRRIRKQRL